VKKNKKKMTNGLDSGEIAVICILAICGTWILSLVFVNHCMPESWWPHHRATFATQTAEPQEAVSV